MLELCNELILFRVIVGFSLTVLVFCADFDCLFEGPFDAIPARIEARSEALILQVVLLADVQDVLLSEVNLIRLPCIQEVLFREHNYDWLCLCS